jgi:Not1 N-terminal domain, CCR4-Not complex component
MGAARKIQTEIDRTLKKVQEGIDVFDDIWDKVRAMESHQHAAAQLLSQAMVQSHESLATGCTAQVRSRLLNDSFVGDPRAVVYGIVHSQLAKAKHLISAPPAQPKRSCILPPPGVLS